MIAVFLLVLGLVAAAAVDPSIKTLLQHWGSEGGLLAPFWENAASAARLTETPAEIAVDYAISIVNIAFGVLLVWKRPGDWVARLFAIGAVGVAMGFNYQAHGIVAVSVVGPRIGGVPETFWFQTAHFVFHALAGASYFTALLIFPNGRFVPRWTKWAAVGAWAITIEELFFPLAALILGGPPGARGLGEAAIPFFFHQLFFNPAGGTVIASYPGLISSEVVFFTILFGLLIPIVGVSAQVYRYRRASSATERAQTHLVVWTLSIALSVGLLVAALDVVSFALRGAVFTPESSRLLYSLLLRITPPLFVVLPVAIAIGVLRYRLFDIEVVVDRTMIYAPLTAAIALVFLGTIFLVQQVLRALIGGPSELAVALAALVNVFLFQPIRRRVQRSVEARLGQGPRQAAPAAGRATASTS